MNYEDRATESVESQTAKAPSILWLGLAVGAMAASAALVLTGRKQLGNFVGQWAPSILIIGVYNKIAKELALPQRRFAGAGTGMSAGMGSTGAYTGAGANAGM